jgi:hypothetical protein
MKMTCEMCDSRNVTLVSASRGPEILLEKTCREADCQHVETKTLRPNVDLSHSPTAGITELHQY